MSRVRQTEEQKAGKQLPQGTAVHSGKNKCMNNKKKGKGKY